MKSSILLLSYYYPPCNATGANRPGSFTKNFLNNNYNVTVITRHWTGEEKNWPDQIGETLKPPYIEKKENLEVQYFPYKRYNYFGPFGFVNTFVENVLGNFNYELQYNQFKGYIEMEMRKKNFDYIMVSSPPLTTVKLGAMMSEKFGVPLIVDFRDLENDIILYKKKKYNWLRWQQHKLLLRHLKRWMQSATIIFTASPPISEYVAKETGKDVFTLNNGYNTELLSIDEVQYKDNFHITVTGTLYEMANLPVMLEACSLLYSRNPGIRIRFNFLGLLINESIAEKFRKVIPAANLNITHRMPQREALKIASSSHVLMLAGFDEMRGAYTTKVFEYLGLRRNILQIPGDRDVVEELLCQTKGGYAPHSAEDAYAVIMRWYNEWNNTGVLSYNGNMQEIAKWSREQQFKKLLDRLQNVEVQNSYSTGCPPTIYKGSNGKPGTAAP